MDVAATHWYAIAVVVIVAMAMAFKPWQVLRYPPLQSPWLIALVLLPWMWWARALMPSGMGLHLSGACLLVLMFGWPMAMLMSAAIGLLAELLTSHAPLLAQPSSSMVAQAQETLRPASPAWDTIAAQIWWSGMVPGTVALLLGLALRRWLARHLFIYILGRGFFTTVIAIALTALLALGTTPLPRGLSAGDWLLGHWLMAWGEGIATGMLVAIFVAFRPQWLLTYSDQRYLHGERD